MTENTDDGPSFNPKTWVKPAAGATGADPTPEVEASAPAEPTMDPRRWARLPTPSPSKSSGPKHPKRLRLIVVGCAATVAVGAFLTLTLWHPPARKTQPTAPTTAVASATLVGDIRRAFTVTSAGDLPSALTAAGLPQSQATEIAEHVGARLSGSRLQVVLTLNRRGDATMLAGLDVRREDGSGLRFTPAGATLAATALAAQTTVRVTVVRGEMNNESFYSSAVAQGLTDSLISPFAQVFAFDFDFQREIAPGDDFEAVIEQTHDAAGQPVGSPRLIYAALRTSAKFLEFYRYGAGTDDGWYDGAGRSAVKSFMRTPVEGARISSGFGTRTHPILGYVKNHNGTDFAAPTGTPIYAASDGTVEYAADKGANGNFVRIVHDNGWRTLYLHLDAFGSGITPGVRVRQGQEIGQVGTTGRSTGPHLHYEVHTEAGPVDPLSIETGTGRALSGPALKTFYAERERIDRARTDGVG